jgi:hypothetical protein
MLGRMLGTVLVAAVACALPCVAEGPTVNPGEWQITAKTEMTGMPMEMPAQTTTYNACMTPDRPVPTGPDQQKECKVSDVQVQGDAVSWTIECNGAEGQMKGSGKIVYQGDTLTGDQNMTVSAGEGMNFKIAMHMTGKRVGPCKEKK